ncbi:hypothetical protein CHS0354_011307 [Potamilus streckersoni]|uniref:DNA damage-inducible protein 1 n=1 Tax=Potamilus streckersoni TaxID=2493646 RepID=A0AAE0VSE6_9BIVA|nr:hypothetical protein CHS0354_011307 [Potamilus streckersoni]
MKIIITTTSETIIELDVSEDLELENLKAQCEFELGIPTTNFILVWNNIELIDPKKSLRNYGIKNEDMILLVERTQQQQQSRQQGGAIPDFGFGNIPVPGAQSRGPGRAQTAPREQGDLEDPEVVRQLLLSHPHERAILKERNPDLSAALESDNAERFAEVFQIQQRERIAKERERIRLLNADPFDPKVQDSIAEEIRLKNIEQNMENAIEYMPETFGQVVMLYVNCIVNKHPIKAFVDSGAQMTIMSQECAVRCNIMRLVDTRWAGIAKGVGTQRILGRVHIGEIQIGSAVLPSSFSILENQPMDMLLGLDMLKRHQCIIDLKRNVLVIGTTGEEAPFLPESELPLCARANYAESPGMSPTRIESEDRMLAEALNRSVQDEASASSGASSSNRNHSANIGPGTSSARSKPEARGGAASGGPRTFPEDVIQKLMTYGFSRSQVIEELTRANGNYDQALAALFAKSFTMP